MNGAHILVTAVVVAASVPARATPAVKLAYDAPPECPLESEFVAAVTARGADFDAPRAARVPEVMVVSIARGQNGFAGAFQVRDDGEATNKREVHGADCREVADALAVVTAIALQGDAGVGSGGAPAAARSSPPPAAADSQSSPPPPAAADSPSSSAPPPAVAPPPPTSPRFQGRTRWRPPINVTVPAGTVRFDPGGSLGLNAGATAGLVPSVIVPQYEFSIVLAPFVTTPDGAQRIHGIILKLDGGIWGPATYRAGGTKTDLWGPYGMWNICLSPAYDNEGLVVLFCFGGGGGALTLNTSAPGLSTSTQTVGFALVQSSGSLEYYLGAGFHVAAEVRGAAAVGQIAAQRADGTSVFSSSPTWLVEGLLGVGFHNRWLQ